MNINYFLVDNKRKLKSIEIMTKGLEIDHENRIVTATTAK
jgi:hypothetical protein